MWRNTLISSDWRSTAPRSIAIVLMIALLSSCSAAHKNFDLNKGEAEGKADESSAAAITFAEPSASNGEAPVYTMSAGDQLEVVFFTHPEQNRFLKVRPDGRVSMPYMGDLVAAGRTPGELANTIQNGYLEILVAPRVDVIVAQSSSKFYVMGEVRSPGEFSLDRSTDMLQAIARAGGQSREARLSSVVLLRKNDEGEAFAAVLNFRDYMGDSSRGAPLQLQANDILWVPRNLISRWDDAAMKTFRGVSEAQDLVIRGWSLINFEDVFQRNTGSQP